MRRRIAAMLFVLVVLIACGVTIARLAVPSLTKISSAS